VDVVVLAAVVLVGDAAVVLVTAQVWRDERVGGEAAAAEASRKLGEGDVGSGALSLHARVINGGIVAGA